MKNLLVIVLLVVVALIGVIVTRPDTYHVERSATIAAPADTVVAFLADFHRWDAWSPWAKLDPNMKADYSGAESGVGAAYHWVGNDKVGEGRMTVTDLEPGSRVGIRLEFIKPFADVAQCAFVLAPDGGGTRVTWNMDGKNSFISKAMCLVKPMDKMIGPDFEKGLSQLASATAATAAAASAPTDTTGATTAPAPTH